VSTHRFIPFLHPSHANLYSSSGSGQQKSTAPATQQETAPAASTKVDTTTTGGKDTTVEQEIAPAIQHETVKREHETREQTVVDRERQ
jgi:hypothetical protein